MRNNKDKPRKKAEHGREDDLGAEMSDAFRDFGRTHKFIQKMSHKRLDFLVVNPPLGLDILDHALICPPCTRKVARAVKKGTAATLG